MMIDTSIYTQDKLAKTEALCAKWDLRLRSIWMLVSTIDRYGR